MNLEGILSIGGKPGLHKMLAQSRGGIIVESLSDKKRFPVSQTSNVSALKDIAIYTYDEEVPLTEVYHKIAVKENDGPCVDHKSKPEVLSQYLEEILPDYDKDRVYNSDLKKLFQWYNILQSEGLIDQVIEEETEETEEASEGIEEAKPESDKDQD
tara:strand:+ start:77 stop:544 length:468 start_codon:yes stop_codon:yes gene_type:complete